MNISFGPQTVKKISLLVVVLVFLVLLAVVFELLNLIVPEIDSLILFLTPQFFGLGIMLYVIVKSREAVREVKSKENSLLASQERFEYLYFSSPVPYINIDSDGVIILVNLAAIRLFDTTEQKLVGQKLTEYLYHESDTKLSIIINQLENKMSVSDVELQLQTMTGQKHWILLSVFSYGNKGEQLVSLVDISRQKEVDMAKTEFVTLASHQLRTPIAATRWNFELLAGAHQDRTEEQQLYYDRVARNIERLTSLVNDFLHVSKLELGTFATSAEKIDLSSFIKTTMEEVENMVKEKNLKVETKFEPENFVGDFDPRLLRIIVANLISNAAKYTPANGSLYVSYEKVKNEIVFRVTDTGIGIPPEEIDSLFSRFFRATNAQEQHVEGTGLGLYIVRQAVEKMGGSITVNSTLGKGSTFVFKLPA